MTRLLAIVVGLAAVNDDAGEEMSFPGLIHGRKEGVPHTDPCYSVEGLLSHLNVSGEVRGRACSISSIIG